MFCYMPISLGVLPSVLMGIVHFRRDNMVVNIYKIKRIGKRNYSHFDRRVSLRETAHFIKNPDNFVRHAFYPFIFYEKKMVKFSKHGGRKDKVRPIRYASHIDRCIYQYYSQWLNELYNVYALNTGIDKCAIAYRINNHKSNIHFAKEVFDFIKLNENAIVIVGDFKGFFDNLDHKYLKEQLCKIIGLDRLPEDVYSVFKSMTKYVKCNLKDILTYHGLKDTYKGIKKLNSFETVIPIEKYRDFKKGHLIKNENNYGIPQGSPLSGIFSNIYMTDFDYKMKKISEENNGIYKRYSDDFIIVIPQKSAESLKVIKDKVNNVIDETPGVFMEKDKTKYYIYSNGCIENLTSKLIPEIEDYQKVINYLGFSFDGKNITIRAKTVGKYIYRMRRKIDTIEKHGGYTKKKNRISYDDVYEKYSIKGLKKKNRKRKGNFISYVLRSKKIFEDEDGISKIEENHMKMIRRTIKRKRKKYSV